MARPPTLLTLVRRLVRERALFGRGDVVLCGCSGGPDSMALLHALALLRRQLGHRLAAVGVDHGLRPEAPDELALVARACQELGVPFEVVTVHVSKKGSLQAAARLARHAALQREAARRQAAVIALGHTADDRAETVLMRLARGSGPAGLAAMPARAPGIEGPLELVRPLLSARRRDVLAHLARHALPYASDPSNLDRRFLRVRVRTELLPLLEQLSPNITGHLCALADALDHYHDDPLCSLSRPQREQIRRLLQAGKGSTTVRVSGGRELSLSFLRCGSVFSSPQ